MFFYPTEKIGLLFIYGYLCTGQKRVMMKFLFISLFLLLIQIPCLSNSSIGIIPRPLSIVQDEGQFIIDERTSLVCDEKFSKAGEYLRKYLPLQTKKKKRNRSIRLVYDEKFGEEAYSLIVNAKGIEIRGGDYGGIFNGIQSLLQILPPMVYVQKGLFPVEVPFVEIKDAPQYTYRGFLLDVARTFQPVDEVKRVIDYMAFCKLNKLHFH